MDEDHEEDFQELGKRAMKRPELWEKAMAGDTRALIEVSIMAGMATKEDFPELDDLDEN